MKTLVKLGIALNFILGIGHLVCMADLQRVFTIYGIDTTMAQIAQGHACVPYLLTIVIASAFLAAAAYGATFLRLIPRLPLQTTAFVVMAVVFFGRAIWGATLLASDFNCLELSSTAVALLLGICYLPCLRGEVAVVHRGERIVSPCGAVCEECKSYPATCGGCSAIEGRVSWLKYIGADVCPVYRCCKERGRANCGGCAQLPCDKFMKDPRISDEENAANLRRMMRNLKA